MPNFSADQLRNLTVRLFKKMGVPPDVAQVVSSNIVENCLSSDWEVSGWGGRFARHTRAGMV